MLRRAAISITGLVLAVFSAGPLWADYTVTYFSGKVIYTKAYWIEGSELFLSEGVTPVDVYEIESITARNMSPDEVKGHTAVMNAFCSEAAQFLKREKVIADMQAANVAFISEKAAGPGIKNLTRKEKKAFISDLKALEGSLVELINAWKQSRIPDFSLLLVRDIKLLQLSSLEASIEKTVKYAGSQDPTYREYAKAHMAQYSSFEESFKERLPGK